MSSVDDTNKNFYQVWGQSHDQFVQRCQETKCITEEEWTYVNLKPFCDVDSSFN